MQEDTIFRMASMTKPIVSVGVMQLEERGLLKLKDPISDYLPKFRNPRVMVVGQAGTVPANREITVLDLLTHTSGIPDIVHPTHGPLQREAGVFGPYVNNKALAQSVDALATLPLVHHPGEQWTYGLSTDVLGRLIEVVSEKNLNAFLREELFGPLRMDDTHFFLPESKLERLAAVYEVTTDGALKRVRGGVHEVCLVRPELKFNATFRFSVDFPYAGPKRQFSAVGGLCSTAPAYMRFCQMLANGGVLDGVRVLRRETVELMTTNQIEGLVPPPGPLHTDKFGLGFWLIDGAGYAFAGAFTTVFWIAPEEQEVLIFLCQLSPTGEVSGFDLADDLESLARQVLPSLARP